MHFTQFSAVQRPVLLDLCCGLGGATRGYQRAGFRVVGVDIAEQPDYCGDDFVQADGLAFVAEHGHKFDAVATSWPCQASAGPTKGTNAARNAAKGVRHVDLNPRGRELLDATGRPYVMENVQGSVLRRDLTLCGLTFGLRVFRHRYFELGRWSMPAPVHPSHRGHRVSGWRHGVRYEGDMLAVYGKGGGKATTAECRAGLGIDWSWDRAQLVEAIPPAYTEHIGRALLAEVTTRRAVAA
jgi:hypothetical protein